MSENGRAYFDQHDLSSDLQRKVFRHNLILECTLNAVLRDHIAILIFTWRVMGSEFAQRAR